MCLDTTQRLSHWKDAPSSTQYSRIGAGYVDSPQRRHVTSVGQEVKESKLGLREQVEEE